MTEVIATDQFVYQAPEDRAALEVALGNEYPGTTFTEVREKLWRDTGPNGEIQLEFVATFPRLLNGEEYVDFLCKFREEAGLVIASNFVVMLHRLAEAGRNPERLEL